MSVSLYEMTDVYRAFLDYDSEPTVDDTEAWNQLLGELADSIESKCINIGYVVKTMEAELKTLTEHKADIDYRMTVRKAKIQRLKSYVFDSMKSTGLKKAEAVDIKVSIAKTPPSLRILDEKAVPEEYWTRPEPAVMKRELLAYVKQHPECDYAWAESGEALRIK